ncbi:MAG TPA: hypothetical protein VMO26_09025 [Vicinamibacterales bacterium]|nr:hypothetical protein [Vicinamibacterales bacterium]
MLSPAPLGQSLLMGEAGPPKQHEHQFGHLGYMVRRDTPRAVAAAVTAVRGTPRTVRLEELPSQAVGAVAGLERGFRDFAFTMRHGMTPGALSRGVEAGELGKFDVPRVEFAGGALNPFNVPGRLLNATDALFRSIARNMELYGLAHAQAKAEGLTGPRFLQRVADLRSGQSAEGAALGQQADTFATRSVFQEQTGPFASWLRLGAQRFPALSFVIPFIKTPANILRQGLEFSPAGAVMQAARQEGRAGRQAQARVVLGTGAAGALAYFAATGRLSGDGPRDRAQRAALMENGWRPNSVRIGDTWVSYSLFQPVSVQAAIIANAYEGWQEQGAKADPSTLDAIGQTFFRSINSFLSQSFLSGLSDFLEAVADPDRSLGRVAGRTASGFIPLTGAVRTVQQAADPVVRQPQGIAETIAGGIPGLSESVEPRISRFGDVVTRDGGPVRRAADPFNVSGVQADPIAQELARLGLDVDVPSDRLAVPGGQALTREQETAVKQRRGQAVRTVLERVMQSVAYQRLGDEGKVAVLERAISRARTRTSERLRVELRQWPPASAAAR